MYHFSCQPVSIRISMEYGHDVFIETSEPVTVGQLNCPEVACHLILRHFKTKFLVYFLISINNYVYKRIAAIMTQ